MYTFVRSYVKNKYHWAELDVSSETLLSLLNTYQNVRLVVTETGQTAEIGIDFKNNKYALSKADKTQDVNTWLGVALEQELSYDNTFVSFNDIQCVRHYNMYDLPITLKAGNINYGEGVSIPVGLETDLAISSEVAEPNELSAANISKNMLFAFNGYFCMTQYESGRAFVLDAKEKIRGSEYPTVSLVDFTDVGGLTQVNMTEENIEVVAQSQADIDLGQTRVVVTIDDYPEGTTPIVILDGHMHILDNSYKRVSQTQLMVTINHELTLKRVAKKKNRNHNFVDSANLRGYGVDGSSLNVGAYVAQSDSFIAFVHTEDLCIFKEPLTKTGLYGAYEHYRAPKGLIINGYNEYMPHIVEEASEEHFSLLVADNERKHFHWRQKAFNPASKFSDGHHTYQRREYEDAYALELYTF